MQLFSRFLKILSLVQILEHPSHPYYVGVQFHPEFKSRPGRPSALFLGTLLTYELAFNFSWTIWSTNTEPFTPYVLILWDEYSVWTFTALLWLFIFLTSWYRVLKINTHCNSHVNWCLKFIEKWWTAISKRIGVSTKLFIIKNPYLIMSTLY
jgi:hypothetical protein